MEEVKDTIIGVGGLGLFLSGLTVMGGGIAIIGIFSQIVLMFRDMFSFLGFGK